MLHELGGHSLADCHGGGDRSWHFGCRRYRWYPSNAQEVLLAACMLRVEICGRRVIAHNAPVDVACDSDVENSTMAHRGDLVFHLLAWRLSGYPGALYCCSIHCVRSESCSALSTFAGMRCPCCVSLKPADNNSSRLIVVVMGRAVMGGVCVNTSCPRP